MPIKQLYYSYSITAAGGSVSLDVDDLYTEYLIDAPTSPTIVADMEFLHTGTPDEGTTFNIVYLGGVDSDYVGGKTVSFFGTDLTDAQAAGPCKIRAYYDGSSWNVQVTPDLSENQTQTVLDGELIDELDGGKLKDDTITLVKMNALTGQGYAIRAGAAGALEEFDASGSGKILQGDGTDLVSNTVSGDITIDGSGVTTIGASKVLTTMIADDNVTVDKVENNLKYDMKTLLVSFETGEQTTYKIEMPYDGTVTEIYAECVKAIAATDDGTITPKNDAGTTMTSGVITFTASDALTTAYTVTPSANNTFVAGDKLQFLTAKATAGGKVQLSIKITRS